jgi:hypothetical protein
MINRFFYANQYQILQCHLSWYIKLVVETSEYHCYQCAIGKDFKEILVNIYIINQVIVSIICLLERDKRMGETQVQIQM